MKEPIALLIIICLLFVSFPSLADAHGMFDFSGDPWYIKIVVYPLLFVVFVIMSLCESASSAWHKTKDGACWLGRQITRPFRHEPPPIEMEEGAQ